MLASLEQYATGRFQPATYLERGITLPFTTPALLGGRIRPGERRGAELILVHPAGGEGVYVLPWAALPDACAPTLHDRALWSKVGALATLTPGTIRGAAREAAAEGLAGRAAARAAREAAAADRPSRTLAHYHLLLSLVRQGEGGGALSPERDTPANVQARAHAVLRRLRKGGGLPPSVAVEALEELAEIFEHVGVQGAQARLPVLLAQLAALAGSVQRWSLETEGEELRLPAGLVSEGAEVARRLGELAVGEARALTDELWALLQRWRQEPAETGALVARPEWVLDGWETICALWRDAAPEQRALVIEDMAALVPVVPLEARRWASIDLGEESGRRRLRRTVARNEDWGSGRMLDLTERNERLRALAA